MSAMGSTVEAGQSAARRGRQLRRRHLRRWFPAVLGSAVVAGLGGVGAGLALPAPPQVTAAAAGVCAVALLRVSRRWWPTDSSGRWAAGAAGEQATAQLLGQLSHRWVALHDRRRRGAGNLDHLLVGPPGVAVIDSKRFRGPVVVRGPVRGLWRPRFEVAGRDCDALVEGVLRQRDEVAAAVEDAGWRVPVRPVIVVHTTGRFRGRTVRGVCVLPASRLLVVVRRGRTRFRGWQLRRCVAHLDRRFPPA